MDYCMIEIAFGNEDEAKKAADELLNNKLASSCQIIESNSYWRWNGERESGREYLMFLKTKKTLAGEIHDSIKAIHSYECFEFAIYDIFSYDKDYVNWINCETKINVKENGE